MAEMGLLVLLFFNVEKGKEREIEELMKKCKETKIEGLEWRGWYALEMGSRWDNVLILELKNYATLDTVFESEESRKLIQELHKLTKERYTEILRPHF